MTKLFVKILNSTFTRRSDFPLVIGEIYPATTTVEFTVYIEYLDNCIYLLNSEIEREFQEIGPLELLALEADPVTDNNHDGQQS